MPKTLKVVKPFWRGQLTIFKVLPTFYDLTPFLLIVISSPGGTLAEKRKFWYEKSYLDELFIKFWRRRPCAETEMHQYEPE